MGHDEHWSERQARWYNEALKLSDYPQKAMAVLGPLATGYRTILDVGAGVGALTIPLARLVEQVTALDPSPAMLEELRRNLEQEGLRNVACIEAAWGEVELPPHDLVLVANVPHVLEDVPRFLKAAEQIASHFIVLIRNVDLGRDKFCLDELYPLLLKKPFERRGDYLHTYKALHRLGIHADVRIIEYDFDQPFADLEEAVEFWKEHLRLEGSEHDEALGAFLGKKLRQMHDRLVAPIHKKSAIISWPVTGERL